MARGSSLSDDKVIDEINQNFVAVDNNISDQGWPADTPALEPWQRWLSNHPGNAHNGFTTSVVIAPDGRTALGTSGSGYIAEWSTSMCYDPLKYMTFLQGAKDKFNRYRSIVAMQDPSEKQMLYVQLVRDIMMENRSRSHPEYSRGN